MKTEEISRTGRMTQGVKMMSVEEGDRVTAMARMTSDEKKADEPASDEGLEGLDSSAAAGDGEAAAAEGASGDGEVAAAEELEESSDE